MELAAVRVIAALAPKYYLYVETKHSSSIYSSELLQNAHQEQERTHR